MNWSGSLILLFVLGLFIQLGSSVEQDFADSNDNDIDDGIVDVDEEPNQLKADDNEEIPNYESPVADPNKFYFSDHFDNKDEFAKKWIKSQAMKDDIAEDIAKYDGEWKIEAPKKSVWRNDFGLVLKSKAKHAAIAAKLNKAFTFNDKPLVVQYEVTMQDGQDCGGSYIKLLSKGKETEDLIKFNDKTPYTIMFGPDKCGNDVKLHFIFRHVNPLNGSIAEKHVRKSKERLDEPFKDKLPHLYQLVLNPDNTFQIRVDHRVLNEGSLLKDFNPPVNPPKEIDDPSDKKPENWDEREKIPDPDSKKPEDWNEDAPPQIPDPTAAKPDAWLDEEPEMIPDPNAKKPDDWDTDMDGEWEPPLIENPICEKVVGCGPWKAPLISNPEYKGKWRAPLIDNPNYQGKWAPRKIPNPDYFEDLNPFRMTPISAVGFELWSMSADILFDNLLITDDVAIAEEWAAVTFDLKRKQIDKESKTLWERAMRYLGYKPGWWALYFLYCAIPFGCYIRYLYKRAKEESFLGKIIKLTNDNPWLWGVYIVILGTPLTFAFYTLCCASKDKDTAAKAKKTDEHTPEDIPNEEAELNQKPTENLDDNKKDETSPSPKSKKSDLEVENTENDNQTNSANDDIEENEPHEDNNARIEEIRDVEAEEVASQNTDGTRKRKSRKE